MDQTVNHPYIHHEPFGERPLPDGPFVRVIVVDAAGSTPADAGASMIVTAAGLHSGTVGGGRIEARAVQEGQRMLEESKGPVTRFFEWNLKNDIGMTCGGTMKVYLERCHVATWPIVIFGAGHVAQALVRLCLTLPCQVTCIDPREDWLQRLPASPTLRAIRMDEPAAFADQVTRDTFIVCMTRGHATDRPILQAILQRETPPAFLGVIGSKSKAAVLRRELLEHHVPEAKLEHITCPVGLPIGSNHPGEIAVSIVAQLLQVRDQTREAV